MQPVKIKLIGQEKLFIKWDDGTESEIPLDVLRLKCPCATCIAERDKQSKVYIPVYGKDQLTIKSINQVGSYAIALTWNDGHNTGIYEFDLLKNIYKSDNKMNRL